MLKKFVSLVVGVSLALATIGVAATSPTVETQSVYDASAKVLTVVTTVTDAVDGSTYTYLAYDKDVTTIEDLEAGDIKYVDQKVYNEANGTNLAFEFETATNNASKLYQDIIKVGGKTAEGVAYEAVTDGVGENITGPAVTVNGADATATFGMYISADVADTDFVSIAITGLSSTVTDVTITKADTSTEKISDYIYSGSSIWMTKADILAAESIAITAETQTIRYATLDMGYIKEDTAGGAEAAPAVIAVGQITGLPRTYGIVFGTSESFENAQALTAAGKAEDGKFAIKIRNFNAFEGFAGAEEIYAKLYYTYEEESQVKTEYGKTFVVDVTGETVSGDKL